jgi:hypothetical protein
MTQVNKHLKDGHPFRVNFILGQSDFFDCPRCGPGRGEDDERKVRKMKETVTETLHRICTILQGDAWRKQRSDGTMLVLRAKDPAQDVFERVGYMRLYLDWVSNREHYLAFIHKEFDGMGWERREMKLV